MTAIRTTTHDEITHFRSGPQWTRLFLAGLESPPIVFAAQVNQTFENADSKDQVLEITYDNVTYGNYTDIVTGMEMWVGSAAGLDDIGRCRIRKDATSSKLYIGEISEIDWDDNYYLSIVDTFGLWQKHVRIISGVPYMDGDIVYSDQHSKFAPVPVMGSDVVLDVTSYPVTVQLDASDSWVPDGMISAYLWGKTDGSISSTTVANPVLTISSYPANGLVRFWVRVTSSTGATSTGYRYIHVYDKDHLPQSVFQLNSYEESFEDGGCSFNVTMLGDASGIRDRAKVILFARDYYAGTRIEIGQQNGRENIIASGWVDGESIRYNPNNNRVTFSVRGAQYWLNRMPGFPPSVEEQRTAIGAWTSIPSLTVDKAVWHLLHWRCTATAVMDVYPSGNMLYASAFEVPTESIWAQIKEIAETSILAVPGCDPYNRFFLEVNQQLVPVADRDFTNVMTLTKADWIDEILFDRAIVSEAAMIDLSGIAIDAPNSMAKPFFSLSPGHVFNHYGDVEILDRLLLDTQSQSNNLAGLVMGMKNNPFPRFEMKLSANNRMIGVFPRQYCNLEILPEDDPRGIGFDGRVIPRNISREWDAETGTLLPTITFEAESFPMNAVTGDPPANNPIPPTPHPVPPPAPPPGGGGTTDDGPPFMAISTWNFGMLYTETGDTEEPKWYQWNGGLTESQSIGTASFEPPIRQILRDPTTGYFYMLLMDYADPAAGDPRGGTHLFVSTGIGAAWTQLLYAGNIPGVTDVVAEQPRIISVGIDPGGGVMAVGGVLGDMRIMLGDAGGLEHVANYPTGLDSRRRLGTLIYSLGKWLLLHAEDNTFSSRAWSRMQSGGIIDTNTSNDFGAVTEHAADRDHWAILLGETILYWTYGDNLIWISGQDPTTATESAGLTGSIADVNQCFIAADPGGTHLIGGGNASIGKRSSDGGASWEDIGTAGDMSSGYRVWGNAGDANQFVAATTEKVMLTLDWGDNWIDKSGNLPYLAPLCEPNHIFAWY